MIELNIDGNVVEVEQGTSVLDAARKAGVEVPTLCHHPDLTAFGGCRLCLVEIEGREGFPASCTTPAEPGMVVRTDTEKLQGLRKTVLELLLTEHPSACLICPDRRTCWTSHEGTRRAEITTGCMFCPNSTRCDLASIVRKIAGRDGPTISLPSRYRSLDVDRNDPFIDRDDNLCILCGRCVRACAEQSLACTLDFMHRGGQARVGTAFNRPLMESGCRFCGSCVDACPTGTLSDRVRRWEGQAKDEMTTTCSFCSVGCQLQLGLKDDRVIEALPKKDAEVNQGDVCVRGRFALAEFVRSVQRLKSPLVRRNGELIEVPWETAFEAAVNGLRAAKPERSALLYSGSCTNEDIFVAHKFARDVLRTNHVDNSLRLSFAALLDGNGAGSPVPLLSDLAEAAAVLVVGADPDFSHPVLAQKIKKAVNAGKTRLVVIGSYATGLSSYASCEIRHAPGEERQVLEGLQQRLQKNEAPGSREDLTQAAEVLEHSGNQGPVVIIFGSGLMRRLNSSANRDLIASLAEGLSAKVLPLLSRANDRGAMEIAAFFGCKGLTAPEIMTAAQKEELDLLYLIGEDIWPGNCNAEFVVLQDTFLPAEAGKFADVVFPVAGFVETDGTYTNLEARIQRLHAATGYALGSMPDWEILCRLAKRVEATGFEYSQPSEIMAELSKTVPFYKGATYTSLEKNGAVFGRTKATKKARSQAAMDTRRGPRSEKPDKEFPLSLVLELDEFVHRATPLRSAVPGIQRLEPGEIVTLSLQDAEALGIEPDMAVNVISRRGSVVATAVLSETAQPGVARMVARGGEASPIPLLDVLLDPVAKAPEEICAVRIKRV